MARSAFYDHCKATKRADQQRAMETRIRAVYDEHKGRYGYRRITAAPCHSMAEPVNHKCVQWLMHKDGAARIDPSKEALPACSRRCRCIRANVLQRDFYATAPNQKWMTDVAEFNVNGHELYLSACMVLWGRAEYEPRATALTTRRLRASSVP